VTLCVRVVPASGVTEPPEAPRKSFKWGPIFPRKKLAWGGGWKNKHFSNHIPQKKGYSQKIFASCLLKKGIQISQFQQFWPSITEARTNLTNVRAEKYYGHFCRPPPPRLPPLSTQTPPGYTTGSSSILKQGQKSWTRLFYFINFSYHRCI
jgi:hypothetical protein